MKSSRNVSGSALKPGACLAGPQKSQIERNQMSLETFCHAHGLRSSSKVSGAQIHAAVIVAPLLPLWQRADVMSCLDLPAVTHCVLIMQTVCWAKA